MLTRDCRPGLVNSSRQNCCSPSWGLGSSSARAWWSLWERRGFLRPYPRSPRWTILASETCEIFTASQEGKLKGAETWIIDSFTFILAQAAGPSRKAQGKLSAIYGHYTEFFRKLVGGGFWLSGGPEMAWAVHLLSWPHRVPILVEGV